LTSFPAFLISNLISGIGLSTLEIAANPFIALCGPPEYGEARLNLSQGIQAIGGIVSPVLAQKVLFRLQADSLIDVQWTYLGIALFTYLLAVAYYYVPLPEATDQDLEEVARRIPTPTRESIFNVRIVWITLGLGVLSQFCYVGGQEAIATSFTAYLRATYPSMNAFDHQAIGHAAFAVPRFAAGFAAIFIKPLHLLLFFYAGAIAFCAAAMNGSGPTPAAIVIMIYFFEGPIFSLIFAMTLRGCGRHTKDASALLTAAISGGSVFPPMMYGAAKARNVQFAYCVVVAAFACGALLPVWFYVVRGAREIVDPVKSERHEGGLEEVAQIERRLSSVGERSRKNRFGMGRRWRKEESPVVEHRERRSWADS